MRRQFLPQTSEEWALVRRAENDGCTGVIDWQVDCCRMHDYYYRHGIHWLDGLPVTRTQADAAYRQCMQERAAWWNPIPVIRWIGVRILGRGLRYGRFAEVSNQ